MIEEVEVTRVTEKSVWLTEGRYAKRSMHANYWHTIEEAKAHLKEKYSSMIEVHQRQIEKAKAHLEALDKY